MLNRESIKTLKIWYYKKPRKPLLIRGAHQVGKTTLVRMFAEMENIKLIEINCEKPWSFIPLIKNLDPVEVIEAIEFELNINV